MIFNLEVAMENNADEKLWAGHALVNGEYRKAMSSLEHTHQNT